MTYRAADGRPLVAPVWFVIEEGRLVFNTGKDTAKGRALARDPRVAVCVDLEQPPFAYVQVQGVAEFSEDPADLVTTATAIGARYMGADLAEEFGRRNGVPGELMNRLDPRRGGLASARQPLTLRHQPSFQSGRAEPPLCAGFLLRHLMGAALHADVHLTAGHDLGSVWFEPHAA